MTEASTLLPTLNHLREAATRIAGDVVRTPLLRSDLLDEATGARVFVKAECLQLTGAFKARGAFSRLRRFSPAEREGGVITWSSGNHGQAIATAARRLGMRAVVLMPSDSAPNKVALTEVQGAEILFFERGQDMAAMADEYVRSRGAVIVPPANDPDVIAGQGTAALEAFDQLDEAGAGPPDIFLTPCGSGGLTAGCATALRALHPGAQYFAVEPEGFDDTARSLAAGARQTIAPGVSTICDALTARTPAPLTFAINQALGVQVLTVTDDDVLAAMELAFRALKVVMEPGGAAALAAVLAAKIPVAGRTVALVCSGGNVEPAVFARAITS
jgi:threonine dehydratase